MVGCQTFGNEPIGFALPIFSDQADSPKLTIQEVDEITGRIVKFRPLDYSGTSLMSVDGPSLRVGDEQIYAFLTGAGKINVGPLVSLRPILEQFAEENLSRTALILQIRELIGNAEEKKVARVRMQRRIAEQQGQSAARSFYEGSVLRNAMWACLLAAAPNEKMARRILEARASLSASITSNGTIAFDLSALTQQDQAAIDLSKILAKLLLEFEPEPNARPTTLLSEGSYGADVGQNIEALLEQISRTRRQEERVALLIASILDNPAVGKSTLLRYQGDKAKFADWTIQEIRRLLLNTEWSSDERIVASLVPKLFTRQYPMSRGNLLLALAKHLGKWPAVNEAIWATLGRTQSMFVDWYRKEIEEELSRQAAPKQLKTGSFIG